MTMYGHFSALFTLVVKMRSISDHESEIFRRKMELSYGTQT